MQNLVEQELLSFPEHLNQPREFSEVGVAQSFVFRVVFCGSLFVILSFSFVHCIVLRQSCYKPDDKS
jgi:hypothetical protein